MDVAIFPFGLREAAFQSEGASPWLGFWRNLKEGFDLFDASGEPPAVGVRDGAYCFGAEAAAPGASPIKGWA